ncbi:hypothetical protein Ae201684P_013826 [Aphanomyces euteiches]|uniref:Uncharacterized protein n=1 Tax=Aphanomyces euteiches TaxID=100861 RepID=A0A6G0W670_9STRA|nr:hypothetical protein Ae201684_018322 [Aphanomyces euteiches]KAH9082923.1 hypothetical protein Ae201684P_013826 [Aphanomyces euteiches]KAH9137348.1 hypothetical protein AeRB84_017898 [Aphanomyces euteiches]
MTTTMTADKTSSRAKGLNPFKAWTVSALQRFQSGGSGSLKTTTSREKSRHVRERCMALGQTCDPQCIVDNMRLQGGVHHTQLLYVVFNGRPLHLCCYEDVVCTWFRAQPGREFQEIAGAATTDWYLPTAEDIGALLLVHVDLGSVVGCVEFGPVVEDPSVRSQVENALDASTAFYTNVRLVPSDNNEGCSCSDYIDETWSLLLDDKRIRLACESALVPPFEALYSSVVTMRLCPLRSNVLTLDFGGEDGAVDLQVDWHDRRDVVYLVFQALSRLALQSSAHVAALSTGQSPMLTCRTLPPQHDQQHEPLAPCYELPWTMRRRRRVPTYLPKEENGQSVLADEDDDDEPLVNSMLLHDVDALLVLSRQLDHHKPRPVQAPADEMQSALEAMKAERMVLERQLDQLRRERVALS